MFSKKFKRRLRKLLKVFDRLPKKKIYLYLAFVTAGVAVAWWAILFFYEPSRPASSASDYKSLDLSLAIKARYNGKPLETVKDFGVQNSVRRELVSFDVAKDGLNEYALMTLPDSAHFSAKKKYPVIILCHGYTNPRAYSTLDAYLSDMEFYSQHGFIVIKPDYRGNGFSVTEGTPDGAYYSMGYNTDVMSLIAAVKKTPYLDAKNINLWGHSMGGYVALRAAVLSPDIKNLILLSAPAGTVSDMYSDFVPDSDANNPNAFEIRDQELTAHGSPLSNPAFWQKTSPLNYLAHMHAFVQIHVGSADQIVPPKFSAELDKALARQKVAHVYYVYPGGIHSLAAQRQVIWARSLTALAPKR